jgi:hypothetical protein
MIIHWAEEVNKSKDHPGKNDISNNNHPGKSAMYDEIEDILYQ